MFTLFADISLSSDDESSSNQFTKVTKSQLRNSIDIMNMPNTEFQNNFRMNKDTFKYISGEISCYLAETHRGSAVTKIIKLATVLRFLATGGYQRGIGNEYMSSLSQSKVSEVIEECLEVMEQHLCPKWINFDISVEEERNTKMKFLQKYNIPGVIGCVDGTHIKIMTPSKGIEHLYRNRKGFYSLNTMMICDSDLVIKYVDTRHPGANHDAFVWSTSEADEYLKNGHMNGKTNTWLLGDGGYQCLPYLLTTGQNIRNLVANSL